MKENKDNIENVERTQNLESLKKLNIVGKLKLKIREIKNGVKTNLHKFKELDKKELFTNIFSSRYFFLFMFIVILLKTLLFSIDTVFYKHGIWLWYIRQTAFFIIIMLAPMFLFRNSRTRSEEHTSELQSP